MHELAITQEIVGIIRTEAERGGAARVRSANLVLGALTGYSAEVIGYYYDLLKADEPLLADSVLTVEPEPAILTCNQCGTVSKVTDFSLHCPACNSFSSRLEGGDAVVVSTLEVEDAHDRNQSDPGCPGKE